MKAVSKHLKSIAWMVFGLFFVFGLVIYMNSKGGVSEPEVKKQSMEFATQKVVKPKPKPKPKPEPETKEEPPAPVKPPLQQVAVAVASIDPGVIKQKRQPSLRTLFANIEGNKH